MPVPRLVPLAAATALAVGTLTVGPTAPAAAALSLSPLQPSIQLQAGGRDRSLPVLVTRGGEGLLDLVTSAPGADWGTAGSEAAVVSVSVDGRYQTDVVIPSAQGLRRQFALGTLRPGLHRVTFHLASDRTAPHVHAAVLRDIRVSVVDRDDAGYLAARYAPVVHGRALPAYGGPLANATTDTPLLSWHDLTPATTPGHVVLQVSYVWSNEDGGTDTNRLMARWGRTTDIEWVYRVELDEQGRRVPGSDAFQAPAHTTTAFHGRYEGTHAVLETCTENNNLCDETTSPMRFALSALPTLPAGQPREAVMDANPWTYQVAAAEMRREGQVEAVASPDTPQLSDQRNYLHLAVKKSTSGANTGASWVGTSLGVTLRGSSRVYRSDHLDTGGATDWSIQRDDPAATTVELPAGTTAADVTSIVAIRVVNGLLDPGSTVQVQQLLRGFFLGEDHLPGPSFVSGPVAATLTAASPVATIWARAAAAG